MSAAAEETVAAPPSPNNRSVELVRSRFVPAVRRRSALSAATAELSSSRVLPP